LIWPEAEEAPEPLRPEGERTGSIFGTVLRRRKKS
jgi:hypothetical protein